MRESDFFNESDVRKPTDLNCPFCRQTFRYEVRWRRRIRKKHLPRAASSEDQRRFAKARSYLIRIDDTVRCQNSRCTKRFEIASLQTVAFLSDTPNSSAGRHRHRPATNVSRGGNQNHQ